MLTQHGFDCFLYDLNPYIYWLFSSIWIAFFEVPSLIIGLTTSLFALVFWYYGIVVTVIKDIAEKDNILGQPIPKDWHQYTDAIVQVLDNWTIFIFIGIVLSFVGAISLDKMIDQAYFIKRYLGNIGGIALRNKIRSRLKKITDVPKKL